MRVSFTKELTGENKLSLTKLFNYSSNVVELKFTELYCNVSFFSLSTFRI